MNLLLSVAGTAIRRLHHKSKLCDSVQIRLENIVKRRNSVRSVKIVVKSGSESGFKLFKALVVYRVGSTSLFKGEMAVSIFIDDGATVEYAEKCIAHYNSLNKIGRAHV